MYTYVCAHMCTSMCVLISVFVHILCPSGPVKLGHTVTYFHHSQDPCAPHTCPVCETSVTWAENSGDHNVERKSLLLRESRAEWMALCCAEGRLQGDHDVGLHRPL